MQSNNNGSSNQNWTLSFTGLSADETIGMARLDAEEGYYLAKIDNVSASDPSRPDVIYFDCTVTEGKFQGARISKGIKLPKSASLNGSQVGQTNNHFVWTSLFQAIGYQTNSFDQNQNGGQQFQVQPNQWIGLNLHVYWKPANKDLGIYRELLFLTKPVWDSRKALFEKTNSIQATQTAPIQKPAAVPPPRQAPVQQAPIQQAPVQQASVQTAQYQPQQQSNVVAGFSGGGGVNQNLVNGGGEINTASLMSQLNRGTHG